MKRLRWIFWSSALVFGLLIFGAFLAYQLRDCGPIRYENRNEIHEGMTLVEVEALLGCPSGDYKTGPVHLRSDRADGTVHYGDPDFLFVRLSERLEVWSGDHGYIAVSFD